MKSFRLISTLSASVLVTVTAATSALAATTQQFTPEANKASYWGTSCVKYENITGSTYSAPAGATKVVVKGGTLNAVYTEGSFTDLKAPTNPNTGKPYGISHVIVCTGSVTTPVTPTTPTTPTTPGQGTGGDQNTPDKPHNIDGKEDKNQSACNPSDTNSANVKHRDDGDDCEKTSIGTISDVAAWTTKPASVKGAATTLPTSIPSTGSSMTGILASLAAGGFAYGAMLLRRK